MKKLFKTIKRSTCLLLLTTALFSDLFGSLTFPGIWEDGMCQTLDNDRPPEKIPITPEN